MCCYDCRNLKHGDKKDGKVNGALYYCSKKKKYINGMSDGCEKYEYDILKTTSERDEIYYNSIHYSNDDISIGGGITIIVVLLLLKLFLTLLGYN